MAGIWIECEVMENVDYDFIIYAIDQDDVMRDDVQPEPGEILFSVDPIIPTLKTHLEKEPFMKKGILLFNNEKKTEQQE